MDLDDQVFADTIRKLLLAGADPIKTMRRVLQLWPPLPSVLAMCLAVPGVSAELKRKVVTTELGRILLSDRRQLRTKAGIYSDAFQVLRPYINVNAVFTVLLDQVKTIYLGPNGGVVTAAGRTSKVPWDLHRSLLLAHDWLGAPTDKKVLFKLGLLDKVGYQASNYNND